MQVRFYQLPDYNSSPASAPSVYRGMQIFLELDPTQGSPETTSLQAITKPAFFPTPAMISSANSPTAVSPILPTAATANDVAHPLPIYQSNYKYASFHFKADGSTDLASGLNSFTLVLENDKPKSGETAGEFPDDHDRSTERNGAELPAMSHPRKTDYIT